MKRADHEKKLLSLRKRLTRKYEKQLMDMKKKLDYATERWDLWREFAESCPGTVLAGACKECGFPLAKGYICGRCSHDSTGEGVEEHDADDIR